MIAKRNRDDAHDQKVSMEWLGAALERQKNLPELKTLLEKREPRKQNHKQLSTMLHVIADRYGLKVRTRKKVPRG